MRRGATLFFQSLPDETRWVITAETVISLVELAGRARRAGAVTQTCIVHLLRASFRYTSRRDWAQLAKDLKPLYTAPTEAAALEALAARNGLGSDDLYLRGAKTLVASWKEHARGTTGATVRRWPAVAAAASPNEPERAVDNNALLEHGLTGSAHDEAIGAVEGACAAAGVTRFAAWAHEGGQPVRGHLERRGYRLDGSTRAMGMALDDVRLPGRRSSRATGGDGRARLRGGGLLRPRPGPWVRTVGPGQRCGGAEATTVGVATVGAVPAVADLFPQLLDHGPMASRMSSQLSTHDRLSGTHRVCTRLRDGRMFSNS